MKNDYEIEVSDSFIVIWGRVVMPTYVWRFDAVVRRQKDVAPETQAVGFMAAMAASCQTPGSCALPHLYLYGGSREERK